MSEGRQDSEAVRPVADGTCPVFQLLSRSLLPAGTTQIHRKWQVAQRIILPQLNPRQKEMGIVMDPPRFNPIITKVFWLYALESEIGFLDPLLVFNVIVTT